READYLQIGPARRRDVGLGGGGREGRCGRRPLLRGLSRRRGHRRARLPLLRRAALRAQSRARPSSVGEERADGRRGFRVNQADTLLSLSMLVAWRPNIEENSMPAVQQTIAPKVFGATSTTDKVLEGVNLKGKRVLVTGVSAGLGVETARALVAHGADVVGAARDLTKAKAATACVRGAAATEVVVELYQVNLASLDMVRVCVIALADDGKPFDLVICNAGVMAAPF